jgi:hypothetical protein
VRRILGREKSSQFSRKLVVFFAILMVGMLIGGCSRGFVPQDNDIDIYAMQSSASPTNGFVQSNDEGQVTIDVEWMEQDGGNLVFAVALNTHSVYLDQYDLGELAVLRDDAGKEYHPTSWDSAPGGHHRRGILAFSPPEKAKYLELVIRGVAEVRERVFRWEFH